jgi:hypothetical protein
MTIAGIIIGWALSSLQQKWKQKQIRIDVFIEKRLKSYSEALSFMHEAEMKQTEPSELKEVVAKWHKWLSQNAVYLPPSINEMVFEAIFLTYMLTITHTHEDKLRFGRCRDKLKKQLTELSNISWLPEDLK